jgi:hypothetical protein
MKRHPDLTGPGRNIKLGSPFSSKRKPILMAAWLSWSLPGVLGASSRMTPRGSAPWKSRPDRRQTAAPITEQAGAAGHRTGRAWAARAAPPWGRGAWPMSRIRGAADGGAQDSVAARTGRNGRDRERCADHDRFDAPADA